MTGRYAATMNSVVAGTEDPGVGDHARQRGDQLQLADWAHALDTTLGRVQSRPQRAGEALAFGPPNAAVRRRDRLRSVLLCHRLLLLGEMLDMRRSLVVIMRLNARLNPAAISRPVPGILGRNRIPVFCALAAAFLWFASRHYDNGLRRVVVNTATGISAGKDVAR